MKNNPTPKKILFSLLYIKPQVIRLFNGTPEFQEIVDFFKSCPDYMDDDNEELIPNLKQIGTSLGLTYQELGKQPKGIYKELFTFYDESP